MPLELHNTSVNGVSLLVSGHFGLIVASMHKMCTGFDSVLQKDFDINP
jgi:hypothetical protein